MGHEMNGAELDKAGGPAFPASIPENFHEAWPGMTLRDYFAAQYMPAAIQRAGESTQNDLREIFGERGGLRREEIASALAYRYADAMLARRHR